MWCIRRVCWHAIAWVGFWGGPLGLPKPLSRCQGHYQMHHYTCRRGSPDMSEPWLGTKMTRPLQPSFKRLKPGFLHGQAPCDAIAWELDTQHDDDIRQPSVPIVSCPDWRLTPCRLSTGYGAALSAKTDHPQRLAPARRSCVAPRTARRDDHVQA